MTQGMYSDPGNREAWQRIADNNAATRPSKGKRVRVTGGRKYKGIEGTVTWHGWNKFSRPNRYQSDAQMLLAELIGTYGFTCRIQPDDGPAFFVDADKVEVIGGGE